MTGRPTQSVCNHPPDDVVNEWHVDFTQKRKATIHKLLERVESLKNFTGEDRPSRVRLIFCQIGIETLSYLSIERPEVLTVGIVNGESKIFVDNVAHRSLWHFAARGIMGIDILGLPFGDVFGA